MESLINNLLLNQWQRKLVALLTAIVIWFFVSHTITSTRTIASVPIRIINLPTDKTIPGLLPNGFLSKRTTITLTGTKDIIDQLEPGDIAITLDVSNLPEDGIVQITKKNLISLNPTINLSSSVTAVSHLELIIKTSPVLTEKVPITVLSPSGDAPKGYEFLDVWPIHLFQTISGPQEQVLALKNQGLEIRFNLDEITKEQLDALHEKNQQTDEVSFPIPDLWKKINIPFLSHTEYINDPEVKHLQMSFLKLELIPLNTSVQLHVFFPLETVSSLNPNAYTLPDSLFVTYQNQVPILTTPLYASNVSRLFLTIVKNYLEINIIAAPPAEQEYLDWAISFINEAHLENAYVAYLINNSKFADSPHNKNRARETYFRQRFRLYVRRFSLFLSPQHKFNLLCRLEKDKIEVHIPNAEKRE